MKKHAYLLMLTVAMGGLLAPVAGADDNDTVIKAFADHCIKCHGKGDKVEGEVNLGKLTSLKGFDSQPALLERVIEALEGRLMPPKTETPLPSAKRQKMLNYLRSTLTRAAKSLAFGATPIRRMNRFQYNNAVVDLLELERDIFQLNERLLRRREDYFRPETKKMPARVRVSSRPLAKDIDNQRPEGFRGVAAFPR